MDFISSRNLSKPAMMLCPQLKLHCISSQLSEMWKPPYSVLWIYQYWVEHCLPCCNNIVKKLWFYLWLIKHGMETSIVQFIQIFRPRRPSSVVCLESILLLMARCLLHRDSVVASQMCPFYSRWSRDGSFAQHQYWTCQQCSTHYHNAYASNYTISELVIYLETTGTGQDYHFSKIDHRCQHQFGSYDNHLVTARWHERLTDPHLHMKEKVTKDQTEHEHLPWIISQPIIHLVYLHVCWWPRNRFGRDSMKHTSRRLTGPVLTLSKRSVWAHDHLL